MAEDTNSYDTVLPSNADTASTSLASLAENRSGVINPQYQAVPADEGQYQAESTYDSTEYAQQLFSAATGQPQVGASAASAAYAASAAPITRPTRIIADPKAAVDGATLAAQRRASGAAPPEPIYGSDYLRYDGDAKAWGNRAGTYNPKKKNLDEIKAELDESGEGVSNLTAVQVSLFGTAYDFMANSKGFVPQDVLRFYLHHLQNRRKDGNYVYMFSERQATDMMPSKAEAPEGMNYHQFLNVMYHVHQATGWSAQKILTAFSRSDGHYGNHPGNISEALLKAQKEGNCVVM